MTTYPAALPPAGAAGASAVTLPVLARMAADGQKIAMLTAYDATLAGAADRAGVDVLLVGDSLGMVVQGRASTLAVSLDDVLYHTRCVAAGRARALVIADLPFGTYQAGPQVAYAASAAALKAGAAMVKLEGGAWLAPTVEFLALRGIPVCGHVGLQPQAVNMLGGYRVQGKTTGCRRFLARGRPRARRGGRRDARRRMRAAQPRRSVDASRRNSGHRHRRRPGVLGTGAGNLRRTRRHRGSTGALRAQLHGRPRQHRSGACGLRGRSEGWVVSGTRALLLSGCCHPHPPLRPTATTTLAREIAWKSSTPPRNSRSALRPSSASPSSLRWAICTTATCRCAGSRGSTATSS